MNTRLSQAMKTIAKIVEVVLWIVTAAYAGLVVALGVSGGPLVRWIQNGLDSGSLTLVDGANLPLMASDGTVLAGGIAIGAATMMLTTGIMAMVFGNIRLIFKTSETDSPFTKANVNRVRRIGELSVIAPLVNALGTVIGELVTRSPKVEFFVNMDMIVFGLVALCLSQFFAYGVKLEHDVDGLL